MEPDLKGCKGTFSLYLCQVFSGKNVISFLFKPVWFKRDGGINIPPLTDHSFVTNEDILMLQKRKMQLFSCRMQ